MSCKNEVQLRPPQCRHLKHSMNRETGVAMPLSHYAFQAIANYRCYTPNTILAETITKQFPETSLFDSVHTRCIVKTSGFTRGVCKNR